MRRKQVFCCYYFHQGEPQTHNERPLYWTQIQINFTQSRIVCLTHEINSVNCCWRHSSCSISLCSLLFNIPTVVCYSGGSWLWIKIGLLIMIDKEFNCCGRKGGTTCTHKGTKSVKMRWNKVCLKWMSRLLRKEIIM